jgi:hypothetical protein
VRGRRARETYVAVIRTDDEAGLFDAFFRHLVGVDGEMDCRGGKD